MPYDKSPPAPVRFLDDGTVIPVKPVALSWPTITALVRQDTAPAENFIRS